MDNISYDDFSKLDLRVAKIISTEKIPEKSRIIKGTISLGDEERDVIIGGAQFYDPEDLIGKTVIVVANLEPKKRLVLNLMLCCWQLILMTNHFG